MAEGLETADRAFGCVFCMTGAEALAAQKLEAEWSAVLKARAVFVLKWHTEQGRKSLRPEVLYRSYVFFEAPPGFKPAGKLPDPCLKLLKDEDGDWRLTGNDAWFAGWLLDQDGQIGLSQARKVGDRVQIQSGPLKDVEGSIIKVDARGRSCQVKLEINGRTLCAWLGFELLEDDNAFRKAIEHHGEQ